MVRKEANVIFAILFLTIFVNGIVSAADVAYIYKREFRVDDNIVKAFQDAGLSVDLIKESNIPRNFDNYRFIFVGDEKFSDALKIPINKKTSIVANYYHGESWGLTDSEGVSLLAATHPLSVRKDGRVIQVYTRAATSDGISIPYYYLEMENIAPSLTDVAFTEVTSSGSKFGTVIAHAEPGDLMANGKVQEGKMCFFGIVESDFWTTGAKNLFNDCIGFVASECTQDLDCGSPRMTGEKFCREGDVYQIEETSMCNVDRTIPRCEIDNRSKLIEECEFGCGNGRCLRGKHDIALVDLTNSVNRIRLEQTNGTDILGNTLICNEEYKISVNVENKGNFSENVSFEGSVGNVNFEHLPIENILPGEGKLKTKTLNFSLEEGEYNITVEAIINVDENLESNKAVREIFVSCPVTNIVCSENSDCGVDGFIGDGMCMGKNVTRDFKRFTCNNPGTVQSSCSSRIEQRTIEECNDLCLNGECRIVRCDDDSDCGDDNPLTKDECLNPGTIVSECRNSPLNCASNADCGFTGFIGNEFCSDSSISKNFQNATCLNPGTSNSACSIEVAERTIDQCQYACFDGACIRCNSNSDCGDGNGNTRDTCYNSGTPESFCRNEETPQEIRCVVDTDCGVDEVISQPFCSVNNVNQLVRKWHCVNSNSSQSFCSSTVGQEMVQQCTNLCTDGRCINIRCVNNGDCNDNNSSTIDKCVDPGTENSICTHDNIQAVCDSDLDCGVDGFISQNICLGNSITRLFQDFTCNNPGTGISFCSSNLRQDTIQTCGFACSNGQCINQPPQCSNECSQTGLKQCSGNGYQTCGNFDSDSCLEWSSVNACSSGQICSNGQCTNQPPQCVPQNEICNGFDDDCDGSVDEGNVCAPSCSNQCTDGARQCSGNGYQMCRDFNGDGCTEWSSATNCGFGKTCSAGECMSIPDVPPQCTSVCSNGARQCSGDGYKICRDYNGDGCYEWSQAAECGFGRVCQDGQCIRP